MTLGSDVRTIAIYALPFTGGAVMLFVIQFFFLKYATDVLLLSPAAVGMVFALSKVFDAVTDPLIGTLSDQSRTKGGRKLWLFGATPLLAVSFYFIWSPPTQNTLIWVSVSLIAFYVSFTAYNIPHLALAAELGSNPHRKTRLYGARQMVETVGMLVAFILIQAISDHPDPGHFATGLMLAMALGMGLLMLGTPVFIRERVTHAHQRALVPSVSEIRGSSQITRLLWVWFWVFAAISSLGIMGPYAAEYILQRPDLIAILPGGFVVAGFLSIPIWITLAGRLGKTLVFQLGLIGGAMLLLTLLWIPATDTFLFVALIAGCGVFLSAPSVLGPSLLADAAQQSATKGEPERQGFYFALFVLSGKVGAAVITGLIGVLIAAIGYVPNEVQSHEVRTNLLYILVGLPVFGCLIGFSFMRRADASARSTSPGKL